MRIFPISDLHLERRTLPLPAIAADFDAYRTRYLRKFKDIFDSLSEQGLTVTRAV